MHSCIAIPETRIKRRFFSATLFRDITAKIASSTLKLMSMCLKHVLDLPKRACLYALLTNKADKLQFQYRQQQSSQIRQSSVASSASASAKPAIEGRAFLCETRLQHSPFIQSSVRNFCSSSSSQTDDTAVDSTNIMELKNVVKKLNRFSPTTLAESWDNVGLLVEPTHPHQVNTLFLTNDLTEEVLEEAITKESNMILSYHPPIFVPLKRLTMRSEKERIIVTAIEKRIAIYSPHTSYDAVEGGVNDWLASGLGNAKVEPLHPSYSTCYPTPGGYKLEFLDSEQGISHQLKSVPGVTDIMLTVNDNAIKMRASMNCTVNGLSRALEILNKDDDVKTTIQITQLTKPPIPQTGMGRFCTLAESVPLSTILQRVKEHLKLSHVQLAIGKDKALDSTVKTVALCAGSGSSILKGVVADLYLTGEMSHHEILAAVAQGTSVILCNHSNTERGFLHVLKEKFNKLFEEKIRVIVSEVDADPLNVV